ncbi:hypothetical protein FRC08_010484 [Ceratobasidium sp. 394]|nr:hypothetical protein FRC08_010484 [Ceratobasidium sp. 394]
MPIAVAKDWEAAVCALAGVPGVKIKELFSNNNKEHPVSCGVGTLEPGASSTYKYPGYEFSIILDGEAKIVDASKPDETKIVKVGDVTHIEQDTTVTWTAVTKLKGGLSPFGSL